MECPNLVVASSRWDHDSLAQVLAENGLKGDFERLTIPRLVTALTGDHPQPGRRLLTQSIYLRARAGVREVYLVNGNPDIGRAAREIGHVLPDGKRVRIIPIHADPPTEPKTKIICCCSDMRQPKPEGLGVLWSQARMISLPHFPSILLHDARLLDHFLKDVAEKSGAVAEISLVGHSCCSGYAGHHEEAAAEDLQHLSIRLSDTIQQQIGRPYHGAIRAWMAADQGLRMVHRHD